MAWDGYFTLDGTEIINGPRVEAYTVNAGKFWLRAQYNMPEMPQYVGDSVTTYTDPVTDNAPWYDPDVPESKDFFGVYPLSVDGIENSTRTSSPVESTADGSTPGRLRHGSKTVVFGAALLGATQEAVDYGIRWLRRALLGAVCSQNLATVTAIGADLGYFSAKPHLSSDPTVDPQRSVQSSERTLRKFEVNNGPTVTASRTMSCGGAMMSVSFTGIAGSPYEFGADVPQFQGYMSPSVSDPWVPGVTEGYYDTTSATFTEVACQGTTWGPLYDPTCPAAVTPPAPPSVSLGCFTAPTAWDRRIIQVPPSSVPLWNEMVPVIKVHAPPGPQRTVTVTTTSGSTTVTGPAGTFTSSDVGSTLSAVGIPDATTITTYNSATSVVVSAAATASGTDAAAVIEDTDYEVRGVRFRFYPDPDGTFDPNANPCAFESDIVVSYIPPNATLTLDAGLQTVTVETPDGAVRRADSLVFATDGTPMQWPSLSCGYGHVITIDTEQGSIPPVVDLTLVPRAI